MHPSAATLASFLAGYVLANPISSTAASQPVRRTPDSQGPMRPLRARHVGITKRDFIYTRGFESQKTFLWGHQNDGVSGAKLVVDMPGDAEAVLSLDDLEDETESISCDRDTGIVELRFLQDAEYQHAVNTWEWLNQGDEHYLLLVAEPGDCGWNDDRVPFRATGFTSDASTRAIRFAATKASWSDIAHTFDLTLGGSTVAGAEDLKARATSPTYDKQIDYSFYNSALFTGSASQDGVGVAANCTNCNTSGKMNTWYHLKLDGRIPVEHYVQFSFQDLGATIGNLDLTLGGQSDQPLAEIRLPVLDIPLPGSLDIPSILTVGFFFRTVLALNVAQISGSSTVSVSTEAKTIGRLTSTIDLMNPAASTFYLYQVETQPPALAMTTELQARLGLYLEPSFAMDWTVLDNKMDAELYLKAPYLDLNLTAASSTTCNVCNNYDFGIKGSLGVEIRGGARCEFVNNGVPQLVAQVEKISTIPKKIASICKGFTHEGSTCPAT